MSTVSTLVLHHPIVPYEAEIADHADVRAVTDLMYLHFMWPRQTQGKAFRFTQLCAVVEETFYQELVDWPLDFRTTFKGSTQLERVGQVFAITQFLIERGWVDRFGVRAPDHFESERLVMPGWLRMDELLIDVVRARCVG